MIQELDALGVAMGVDGQQGKAGIRELALESVDAQIQGLALEDIPGLVDSDFTARTCGVRGLVILQLLRPQHHVGTAKFHAALGFQAEACLRLHTLALDKGRRGRPLLNGQAVL
ncbi:hypothetical protein [Hylemonella gracilis]|uniref:hypothetical protein n=1 Tax=Hylemonella gracilis TaxID=80880 RepID=UPI001F5FF96E|nr:hypothetical protein [Hylemonella gracilis]